MALQKEVCICAVRSYNKSDCSWQAALIAIWPLNTTEFGQTVRTSAFQSEDSDVAFIQDRSPSSVGGFLPENDVQCFLFDKGNRIKGEKEGKGSPLVIHSLISISNQDSKYSIAG